MSDAVVCGECGDAPATTGAWFNGVTWMELCDECFGWWENHSLVEPRTDRAGGHAR